MIQSTGAGYEAANGFYLGMGDSYRMPSPSSTVKVSKTFVPDTISSSHIIKELGWSNMQLTYKEDSHTWTMVEMPSHYLYASADPSPPHQPPATGWTKLDAAEPLPSLRTVYPLPGPPNEAWNKMSPQVREALFETPGTTALAFVLLCVAYYIWSRRLNVDHVAFSYAAVIEDKKYWLMIFSSLSHFDIFHLLFNLMSLYALQPMELRLGTFVYLLTSLELIIVTMLLNLFLYKSLAWMRSQQQVGGHNHKRRCTPYHLMEGARLTHNLTFLFIDFY